MKEFRDDIDELLKKLDQSIRPKGDFDITPPELKKRDLEVEGIEVVIPDTQIDIPQVPRPPPDKLFQIVSNGGGTTSGFTGMAIMDGDGNRVCHGSTTISMIKTGSYTYETGSSSFLWGGEPETINDCCELEITDIMIIIQGQEFPTKWEGRGGIIVPANNTKISIELDQDNLNPALETRWINNNKIWEGLTSPDDPVQAEITRQAIVNQIDERNRN